MEKEKREIKKMPNKETLEAFINGLHGGVRVSFNVEKGVFEWVDGTHKEVSKVRGVKTNK